MAYRFTNNASTTITGAIGAGDTSIVVASAAGFPTAGDFTIIIDSEILLVTGVAGTTWTVARGAEGTSAAAHSASAAVTHILTAAPLNNLTRPSCLRARRATSHQPIPNDTVTTVIFNSVVREDDESAALSISTATGVVTIAVAGWYAISAGVMWDAFSTGDRLAYLQCSTAGVIAADRRAANSFSELTLSSLVYLNAAETLRVQVRHTQGASLDIQNDPRTFLSVQRVRG